MAHANDDQAGGEEAAEVEEANENLHLRMIVVGGDSVLELEEANAPVEVLDLVGGFLHALKLIAGCRHELVEVKRQ